MLAWLRARLGGPIRGVSWCFPWAGLRVVIWPRAKMRGHLGAYPAWEVNPIPPFSPGWEPLTSRLRAQLPRAFPRELSQRHPALRHRHCPRRRLRSSPSPSRRRASPSLLLPIQAPPVPLRSDLYLQQLLRSDPYLCRLLRSDLYLRRLLRSDLYFHSDLYLHRIRRVCHGALMWVLRFPRVCTHHVFSDA
jgi:hypothetical protein